MNEFVVLSVLRPGNHGEIAKRAVRTSLISCEEKHETLHETLNLALIKMWRFKSQVQRRGMTFVIFPKNCEGQTFGVWTKAPSQTFRQSCDDKKASFPIWPQIAHLPRKYISAHLALLSFSSQTHSSSILAIIDVRAWQNKWKYGRIGRKIMGCLSIFNVAAFQSKKNWCTRNI